jgi:hypothetical protein
MSSQRRGLCYHYAPRAASKQRLNGVLVHWCGVVQPSQRPWLCVACRRPARRRCGGVKFTPDDDERLSMIIPDAMFYFLPFALFTVLHPGASERAPTTRCSQELRAWSSDTSLEIFLTGGAYHALHYTLLSVLSTSPDLKFHACNST